MDIREDWFYMPIKVGRWGDVTVRRMHDQKIFPEGKQSVFIGDSNSDLWMANDERYDRGFQGLRSQYYNASGRVLLGGLGLGLLTLIVAEKPDVREVVVVELNPNVISAFRANGWNESKITIVNASIKEYTDTQGFDWILLDHVNQEGSLQLYHRYLVHIKKIIANVGMPRVAFDYFTWEELYTFWLFENKREDTHEAFKEFSAPLHMRPYSPLEMQGYLDFYKKEVSGEPTIIDPLITKAIQSAYHQRKPK